MFLGEQLKLPIFSDYQITRLKSAIVMTKLSTDFVFATSVECDEAIISAIESHNFEMSNTEMQRLIVKVKAEKLREQGYTFEQMAKKLAVTRSQLIYNLNLQ